MTTYDWTLVREDATSKFGETPAPHTEQEIIDVFEEHPRRILELIDQIARERAAGENIRSCWAVLRHRAYNTTAPKAATATDAKERDQRIRQAEAWTRVAGLFLPLPEYERVLFSTVELTPTLDQLLQIELNTRDRPGRHYYADLLVASIKETEANGPQEVPDTRGVLHDYDTPELRQRMRLLHAEYQGRALATEREHEQRAQERAAIRNPPPEREPPF